MTRLDWRVLPLAVPATLVAFALVQALALALAPRWRRASVLVAAVVALVAPVVATLAADPDERTVALLAVESRGGKSLVGVARSFFDRDGDGFSRASAAATATTRAPTSTRAPRTSPATASTRTARAATRTPPAAAAQAPPASGAASPPRRRQTAPLARATSSSSPSTPCAPTAWASPATGGRGGKSLTPRSTRWRAGAPTSGASGRRRPTRRARSRRS